jgi:hypothetical protein
MFAPPEAKAAALNEMEVHLTTCIADQYTADLLAPKKQKMRQCGSCNKAFKYLDAADCDPCVGPSA